MVWALKTPGNLGGPLTLYAFDALNMSHTLFNAQAGQWTRATDPTDPTKAPSWIGGALISPVIANGKVYVPTDGSVAVFGLH